jgi:hypothetical protein
MIEPPKKQHIQNVVNESAFAAYHQKDESLLLPQAFVLQAFFNKVNYYMQSFLFRVLHLVDSFCGSDR